MPRQQHPRGIILDYFKAIKSTLLRAREAIRAALSRAGVRLDADNRANRALEEAYKEFSGALDPRDLEDLASDFAGRTSRFQKEQLDRQIRAAVGVDVFRAEPDLSKLADGFVSENVALIKSIPDSFFSDVEVTVARGIREGMLPGDLADAIEERFGVTEDRAMLIARDQIGKFAGQVNEARQTELGIDKYVWRSSNDERTREGHLERDGEIFSWDDEPEDAGGGPGHPGEPINCRCFAEPDLSQILESLD